jgi:non-heme chloroperoxidase
MATAPRTADLLKNAELKVYPGAPHGLTGAHEQEFNADLLAFARA